MRLCIRGLSVIGILFLAFAQFSCTCSKTEEQVGSESKRIEGKTLIIETQQGTMEFELFPEDAPKPVARIKELARSGFYNGLTFWRVVPNFVIQGGDPQGDGTGGSGVTLPAEFNSHQHIEGALAMARAADPNSADSQFYVCLGRHPYLDNNYTVFGQIISGMDVARKIKKGDKMTKVYVK